MKRALLYLSLIWLIATLLSSLFSLGLTWKMPFAIKTVVTAIIATVLYYLNALIQPHTIGEQKFNFDTPCWFYEKLSYLIAVGFILVPFSIGEDITWLFKAYFTTMNALIIIGQIAFFLEWKAMFTRKQRISDVYGGW